MRPEMIHDKSVQLFDSAALHQWRDLLLSISYLGTSSGLQSRPVLQFRQIKHWLGVQRRQENTLESKPTAEANC